MPTFDLGLEHVSLDFATKTIFTDVTQGVFEGDRIGIVGRNGDGKSTLLHLLEGTQAPDSGRVTTRNGLTFGMLDQRDQLDDDATIREAALEGREDYEWAAQTESREIVEALLGGLNLNARIGTLSGGQRRRADLARLLLKDWDVLALDEPTNHLDVVTIHWLAEHLKNRWAKGTGALLIVTHDRWFLDEVCESMWEVHDGQIEPFEGGYSAYMLQRVERDRQADVRETKRRNLARKELAWLSRGARARSTKQKFHVKAARELIADVPPMRNTLELKQMATSRLGKQVVDLVDVTQIFDREQGAVADIDPDIADMEAKITARTKAIVIINPNNPTGAVYPREILEQIVEVARKHQLMILSDEIYDRLCMDGYEHISIASMAPDVFCVTFSGLSKSHMVAGYRIGWMVLSGDKARARDYILGVNMLCNMRMCSNVPAQSIVQTALGGHQSVQSYIVPGGRVYEQREYVYNALNDIPGVTAVKPKAGFYIFPKLDVKKFNITDDEKFALDLLHEKRLLVVHGGGFNWKKPDHFRVVYLPRIEVLGDAMRDLGDFLSRYRQA